MWSHVFAGFTIGLSAGLGCVATCAPIFLAAGLQGADGPRRGVWALLQLLFGRLAGYVAFGLALGAVGKALLPSGVNILPFFGIAEILLAAFLVAYGLGFAANRSKFCAGLGAANRFARFPFFIGLLTGFALCPPFLAAAVVALRAESISGSAIIFTAFFAGTSVYALPFFVVPFAGKVVSSGALRRLGQAAVFVMAAWFFIKGVSVFSPVPKVWEPPYPESADLAAVEPGATRFEFLKAPRRKWNAYEEKTGAPAMERRIGIIYYSQDTFPEGRAPKGYAGPVPSLVSLDNSGKIRGISLHHNIETGSYAARLDPVFLQSLKGKPYTDPFRVGEDIDAITGATKTLDAFLISLRETVRDAALNDMGLPGLAIASSDVKLSSIGPLLALIPLTACALIVYFMGLTRIRYVILGVTVIVLGFAFRTYLDLSGFLGAIHSGADIFTTAPQFALLLFIALAGSAAFGRFYCGYFCPFGALSELVSKIPTPKIALSRRGDGFFRPAKYIVLAGLIVAYLMTRNAGVFFIEPFAITFAAPGQLSLMWSGGSMLVIFAGLMLAVNLAIPRFWCRYLCPTGACLSVLSLLGIWYTERKESACHGCYNQGFGRRHECFNCLPVRGAAPDGIKDET
ncbi:MAG: 4Fe-4S binding protein [Planctomycetota bacterium]|nr:MAG: 4Fe-4S binding protein [Planctomycetota bacterium]